MGVPNFGGTEGVPVDAGRVYVFSGADWTVKYTWNGEAFGCRFGYSVSGAGDVNNDGYGDVVIGAPYYGGGYVGRVYVFSGLDGSELYRVDGGAAGDRFGWSVSGAGDVNNDGYDDFIVGAPYYDNLLDVDAGKATVYSGQTGAAIRIIVIATPDARLGYSVAGVGDANNDGWADFAIGVPGLTGGTGQVRIHSGQGGVVAIASGENAGDNFGHSVSGAGDVNNDGYDDVIVGAIYYGGGAGRAYAYSVHDGSVLFTMNHVGADRFGHTVSGIRNCFSSDYTNGDIDGDGCDDVIVGAMLTELAQVYSGQSGALLCSWTGDQPGDAFGWSVSGAGDVDNDGFPDAIVGAYLHDNAYTDEGRAYIFTRSPEAIVPAVSSWGMVILVVLLVASSVFLILRRKRAWRPA